MDIFCNKKKFILVYDFCISCIPLVKLCLTFIIETNLIFIDHILKALLQLSFFVKKNLELLFDLIHN